jgi:putative membrane protein
MCILASVLPTCSSEEAIMKHSSRTSALIAIAVVTASGLAACKGRDTAATDSAAGRVDSTTVTSTAVMDSVKRADSLKATARSGWTEPAILGYTSAANNGEIALGQLGVKKATNAKVKAYARELITEHRALLAEGKSMASKLSTVADTAADDVRDLMSHASNEVKDLTDKAAGADWDKDFINKMIDDHQKVLDKLQDAAKNTTNTELRAALEKATGKVQQHLTKAQDIKANVLKD